MELKSIGLYLTPWRPLSSLIEPEKSLIRRITCIILTIFGTALFPINLLINCLYDSCACLKTKKIVKSQKKEVPLPLKPAVNTQEKPKPLVVVTPSDQPSPSMLTYRVIKQNDALPLKLKFFDVSYVSPYKPIGYPEKRLHIDINPVVIEKSKEPEIETCKTDQHYFYHTQSLYDLINCNSDVFNDPSILERLSNKERNIIEELHKALISKKSPKEICKLFIAFLGIATAIPQKLLLIVHYSFGDLDHAKGNRHQVNLPEKGIQELINLVKQLPQHHWRTIQSFLVKYKDAKKVEELLSQLKPAQGKVFCYNENELLVVEQIAFNR